MRYNCSYATGLVHIVVCRSASGIGAGRACIPATGVAYMAVMQLLIYEPSFLRIRAELERSLPGIEPLLMAADGSLTLDRRPISVQAAQPVAAWANSDLYSGGPLREFMIACLKSNSLRWVQSSAAGFDDRVFSMLVDKGITLSTSNASAISIAEFVIAAVFDEFQPQAARRQMQRERRWERSPFREVAGTRWMVIGVGNIGGEVGKRARVLGAHVLGVRRSPRGDEPVDEMLVPAEMLARLPECDVVVLCTPANRDSRQLVGGAFLAQLSPSAILINIARGALIDEAALLESLDRGRPARAVLDVFETEPLPEDSPLWSHPRVRLSAHSSALGSGFVPRGDAIFLDNLLRFSKGEQPRFIADPATVKGSGS
jgi:phosphoglycerate dehydrogenase-like enzyme